MRRHGAAAARRATLGGPETAAPGHAEVGLGFGGGASLFPGAHTGGEALFGRYRRGVIDRLDLGVDVFVGQHGQYGFGTGKVAGRYRIAEHVRLEAGLGAADDSLGKSLNADLAVTVGTARSGTIWNHYAAVRVLGAYGLPGDIDHNAEGPVTERAPPSDIIGILTAGTSGRITEGGRIVFEGGGGPEFVHGQRPIGIASTSAARSSSMSGRIPQGACERGARRAIAPKPLPLADHPFGWIIRPGGTGPATHRPTDANGVSDVPWPPDSSVSTAARSTMSATTCSCGRRPKYSRIP